MDNYNQRKIYLISAEIDDITHYKIGFTKRDVETRIKEFKTGNCSNFQILYIYTPDDYPVSIERALHKHFNSKKIEDSKEWFRLSEDDLENFPKLCESFYDRFHLITTQNTYMEDSGINFK